MNLQFQKDTFRWAEQCFGEDEARNQNERALRFLEEAVELAQAAGVRYEQARSVVEHVFARPAGELNREFGGTMTTLAVLAQLMGWDAAYCGEAELLRNIADTDKIRAKWLTKPESIKGDVQ